MLAALPARAQLPPGLRLDDVGSFTFDEREGLPASTIFDVRRFRDGEMWLGAATGAYRKAGDRWLFVPPPEPLSMPQVRMLAEGADGTRWFCGRFEVYRMAPDGTGRVYRSRDGLPDATHYSIAVTSAIDGTPAVVVGTDAGLYRLGAGDRFVRIPLPDAFDPTGMMLAVGEARDKGDEGDTAAAPGPPVARGEALWLASIATGVARLAGGRWTTWGAREGLHPIVESVAPGAPGDTVEAIAATYEGAYSLVRGRWRALPGLGVPVNRALRVRSGGRFETWLGTVTGRVLRDAGPDRWSALTAGEPLSTSPVVAFRAVDEGVGDATIYAGFRGGSLTRLRTGRAARVLREGDPLGYYVTAVRELQTPGGPHELALFRVGVGMQRTSRPAPDPLDRAVDLFSYAVGSIADGRPYGDDLWIGTRVGTFRWRGTRWERDASIPGANGFAQVAIGPGPGGGTGVLRAAPNLPLLYRAGGGWRAVPDAPIGNGNFMQADTVDGVPTLWLHSQGALFRHDARRGSWSRVSGLEASQEEGLVGARTTRLASGEWVLWVGSISQGVGRRVLGGADSSWHWITTTGHLGLPSNQATALEVAPGGDLLVGTDHGLVILRAGARARDSVAVHDVFLAADGLPHEFVTTVSLSRDGRRAWVGTLEGLGAVDLTPRADAQRGPPPLILTVRRNDEAGSVVPPGATVRWNERSLNLDFWLRTFHREGASRYRVEVDGESMAREVWRRQRLLALPALAAGRHEIRLWGMDWRGRVSGPATFVVRVAPPPWRSTAALGAYAVAGLLLLVVGDRWRQASLRLRAQTLEASERRLAASELRFRRLFEDGADAQLLVRRELVVDANPAAVTLLAAPARDALLGRPIDAIVDAPLPRHPAATEGEAPALVETTAHPLQGDAIPVAARRIAIAVPGDPFDCVELRDLRAAQRMATERTLLEQQLREAQRLESLGNLAGGVAHDFNNLLTVIQGHGQLLLATGSRSPDDRDSVSAILRAAERARGIVRQILTFSRRSAPRRVPVALGELLREMESMLRASIPSTVALDIDDRSGGARLLGDPTELHQLLLNLAANAEYAMRETGGGTLGITLEVVEPPSLTRGGRRWPGARAVRLEVRDTGAGMPPDVQQRIFEPFFTTKPVGEGTGLGLAVLHGIVTSHDGVVEVSSAPGAGTTFVIHFPVLEGDGDAPAASAAPAAPRERARRRRWEGPPRESILVVDDERAVANVTAMLLESAGYRVTRCYAPGDALAAISSGAEVDLVITDQTMPGMTGDALATRLHALRPPLPIIIATGYSRTLVDADLATMGVRHLLEKPFSEEELLAAVSSALHARGN